MTDEKCTQNFGWKTSMEDLGVNGNIILNWVLGKYGGNWIHLAQDRDLWPSLVNTVMSLRVP
jgi:hypothetical protein